MFAQTGVILSKAVVGPLRDQKKNRKTAHRPSGQSCHKKPGDTLKDTKGIAGGAIMEDGKVGLILDMAGIWVLVMGVEN